AEVAGHVGVAGSVQREAGAAVVPAAAAAADPAEVALGRVPREEDVVTAGADEGGVAERGRLPEAAGDVDLAGGVHDDGAAHVVGGAAAAPAPECVPVRGVLHEEDVLAALAREREGAEGGGPREAADEVDVAAVYGDGVGALAACAPPPVSPEHVALGRVLHEEDVVVAGTGQGDVPERGRVPEAAADVG